MINKQGIAIADVPGRKYIVSCSKFDGVNASGVPRVGQVATNSKLLAYFFYRRWDNFSKKYLNERDDNFGYTIAVSLYKRNKEGLYNAIKR
jgi:hypothetical protein